MEYGILLCYEPNIEFCHRHIVTGWFEILLDINVPEIKVKDGLIEKTKNLHIKQYLEDEMRFNRNIRVVNSLRILYLSEKGEKL